MTTDSQPSEQPESTATVRFPRGRPPRDAPDTESRGARGMGSQFAFLCAGGTPEGGGVGHRLTRAAPRTRLFRVGWDEE